MWWIRSTRLITVDRKIFAWGNFCVLNFCTFNFCPWQSVYIPAYTNCSLSKNFRAFNFRLLSSRRNFLTVKFPDLRYFTKKKEFLIKSISSRDGPENVQKQGRDENMQEDYPKSTVRLFFPPSFPSRVVFLRVFTSASFLYFLQVQPYMK